MKVVLATANYPPEFEGGTERVVRRLALALVDRGHEVAILTGSDERFAIDSDARVRSEQLDGLTVYRVRRTETEGYGLDIEWPNVAAAALDVVERLEPDVVHVHHWSTLSTGLVRGCARAGVPVVASLHDMWTTCARFFRRPPADITCPDGADRAACAPCARSDLTTVPLWKLRLGIANRDREIGAELAAATAVTAPSRASVDRLVRHLVAAPPIEVVPHGLLEPVFGERRSLDDAWSGDRPLRVGTFGNLVVEKGVLVLLEAVGLLVERRGPNAVTLCLHGRWLDAELHATVADRARQIGLRLEDGGPYAHDAAAPHPARSMDLAVFPSLCEETYGLVVEEALARGVPVVVSDLGALAERIGDGGLVTRAGDAEALAAAIGDLVGQPDRYRQLVAGIPETFATIAEAATRYDALYRAAVGRG